MAGVRADLAIGIRLAVGRHAIARFLSTAADIGLCVAVLLFAAGAVSPNPGRLLAVAAVAGFLLAPLLVLWLTGLVEEPVAPEQIRSRPESDMGAIDYGTAELRYASLLRGKPDAKERIAENWDLLVDPSTTLAKALPLLGLPQDQSEPPRGVPCR